MQVLYLIKKMKTKSEQLEVDIDKLYNKVLRKNKKSARKNELIFVFPESLLLNNNKIIPINTLLQTTHVFLRVCPLPYIFLLLPGCQKGYSVWLLLFPVESFLRFRAYRPNEHK